MLILLVAVYSDEQQWRPRGEWQQQQQHWRRDKQQQQWRRCDKQQQQWRLWWNRDKQQWRARLRCVLVAMSLKVPAETGSAVWSLSK